MLRTRKLKIAAGGSEYYAFDGDYIRVAASAVPIIVETDDGDSFEMYEGEEARLDKFKRIRVRHTDAAEQSVILAIGSGGVGLGSARVAGVVSIINGELSRVKSLSAFIGKASCTGGAGLYSHAQIYNPAGSGKNVIVNKISVYGNAAPNGIGIQKMTAALATLIGNGSNKFIGAAASSAELRQEANAGVLGVQISAFAISAAKETKEFSFSEPLVISPGNGLAVFTEVINTVFNANFQWNEELI